MEEAEECFCFGAPIHGFAKDVTLVRDGSVLEGLEVNTREERKAESIAITCVEDFERLK